MAAIRAVVALLMVMAGLAVIAGPASAQDFSGDVDVILRANGSLDINGDNNDNRITLCQNPDDAEEFTVIIILSSSEFETETVNGVTTDVRINMKRGDDVVQLNGNALPPIDCDDVYPPTPPLVGVDSVCDADEHGCHSGMLFPRDVRVLLGPGYNSFNGYEFGVVDDLTIRGGSGFDSVTLDYVNIWDRADINVLSGGSLIRVADSYFGRSSWRASSGVDDINLRRSDLGSRPIIATSAGDDRISVSSHAEGRFTINTGNGGDRLQMFSYCDSHGTCTDDAESRFMLNVIMGGQDDLTAIEFPLVAGDRLNGGSGNGDRLETANLPSATATGGPTINGYEFFGPFIFS